MSFSCNSNLGDDKDVNRDPDAVRRRYHYRKLVMNQGIKVPARLAMKMVGPDCAFHLYSQHNPGQKPDAADSND
ncbi:MAG: hypothetical protein AAF939_19765 [Planctomycetota bacterium]